MLAKYRITMDKSARTILLLVTLSTISYGIAGVIAYKGIKAMPLYAFILVYGIGLVIGLFLTTLAFGMRFRIPIKDYSIGLMAAFFIAVELFTLFYSYKHYDLAGIYPFIALSTLFFLGIDIAVYRRRLPRKMVSVLLFGVLLIIVGTFVTGSSGLVFNVSLLPIIMLLAIAGGLGDYLLFYKPKRYTLGSKMLSDVLVFLLFGTIISALHPSGFGTMAGVGYALLAGILGVVGTFLDVHAIDIYKRVGIVNNVAERNFINDFAYMDTVLVLIGSVVIGSFTLQEVAGGIAIIMGVFVLDRAKGMHMGRNGNGSRRK